MARDGFESIDRTHLPRQTEGLVLPIWFVASDSVAVSGVWCYSVSHSADAKVYKQLPTQVVWNYSSTVRFYTMPKNLKLPICSLVEEFKVGNLRFHMMMRDSANEFVLSLQPDNKTGTKLSAVEFTQEAASSLRSKEIIGANQTNRADPGSTSKYIFSEQGPKG